MIEARAVSGFLANDRVEVHRKAHLALNRNPGAGAWLTSLPNSPDTHFSCPLFTTLRRRRMPISDDDSFCPLCGQAQDRTSPVIAAPCPRSRRNLAFCRSARLTMGTLPSPPPLQTPRAAISAALLTSGSLRAPLGSPSLGLLHLLCPLRLHLVQGRPRLGTVFHCDESRKSLFHDTGLPLRLALPRVLPLDPSPLHRSQPLLTSASHPPSTGERADDPQALS